MKWFVIPLGFNHDNDFHTYPHVVGPFDTQIEAELAAPQKFPWARNWLVIQGQLLGAVEPAPTLSPEEQADRELDRLLNGSTA